MKAKKLEDLQIWQRARRYAQAMFAIVRLPTFDRDLRLREQINDSGDSIMSNIAEGFGQSTDRAFARYLIISRSSLLESRSHLVVAVDRKYVCAERVAPMLQENDEIEKMMLALIRYLNRSNRKNRLWP